MLMGLIGGLAGFLLLVILVVVVVIVCRRRSNVLYESETEEDVPELPEVITAGSFTQEVVSQYISDSDPGLIELSDEADAAAAPRAEAE
jgi:hypothetical protein